MHYLDMGTGWIIECMNISHVHQISTVTLSHVSATTLVSTNVRLINRNHVQNYENKTKIVNVSL